MKVKRFFLIFIFSMLVLPEHHLFLQQAKSQQLSQANIPDSLNVRLIGRWAAGPCMAVDVAGTIAYFGNGSYLEIVDFSNPAQPNELSKLMLSATVLGVAISGNYAYIANAGAGLRIIDVSNPSEPAEVAFFDTPGMTSGLAVSGTRIYLADGNNGMRIIDISDPSQPKEIGFYDTNGWAKKVAINSTFAYIADMQGGLRVIDISNFYQPIEIGVYTTTSDVMDVEISGNFACVAAYSAGFRLVDISKPYNPSEISFLNRYQFANGIMARGAYAYLTDTETGLRIIDIANPYQPHEAGYYDTDGTAHDLTLISNYAFIADGHNGLRVIDVSNYFDPNEIGYFKTDGSSRGVTVDNNYAYLVKWKAGLRVIDIADPFKPFRIGSLNLNGRAEDVVLKGNNAYLTNYDNGLRIIDISDRSQPNEIGSITQDVNSKRVIIKENFAYVADTTAGLHIVDISNPSQPILINSYGFPGKRADAISIKNNYAYLAAGNDGLRIIDISIPSQPVEIGVKNLVGTAISIDVNGNYAYLGTLQNDFKIINIHDPAQPIEVGSLKMNSPLHEMVAKARYVYIANKANGLQIIDVLDPSHPIEAGFYVTGSTAYGLTLDDNYIYLSCGETGLYILEFLPVSLNKPPLSPILILPANKSFLNSAIPQLTWQIPADENGDLLHFKVELDKDGIWNSLDYVIESKNNMDGFSPIPPVAPGSGSMNFTIQSLLSENNWYWRVSAWDGLVYGEYSTVLSFTIDTTAPVLKSVTFERPGYDENWFNPNQDTSVTLIVTYDELYPQIGSLAGAILPNMIFITGLPDGFNQEVKFDFSIANQHDGTFPLQASIQDSAKNSGSKAWAIQLDSTPPAGYFSDAPDTIPAGQNYIVHVLAANDSLGCGVAKIYLDVFSSITGDPTTVQDSIVGVIKPGIYFYRYFAEDHLGNRGKTKTDTTVVIPVYPQAPIFPASHSIEVTAGDNFWIDIQVGTEQQPVENLFSASFILNYSNTLYVDVISQDSIEAGDFLGNNVNLSSQIDDQNGKITIDISRISGARNVDGYGKLVRIKYSSAPKTPDRTAIHFTIPGVTAADSAAYPIDLMPQDTTIWLVKPFSAFAMTIIPDSQSIHQGDSTNFIISFESLGVFDSQITMSITEIPVGMQIIFPSQPFDIPATDTITFATSDEITPGFYAPIITATGGGTTQVDTVIIKVLPKSIQPDFVMTVQPEHQTIHQGKSTDFTLSFHPTGEFDSQISLEISDLPSGMDATYPSDTFTIPTSFDVIFSTTVDIEPGIYHPIIKASGGGTTHQVRTKITVFQQADFIMIIEPDSQAVTAGDSIEFHISFIPVGGFNSQITVAVSNVPAGMDAIYTSGPFNIPLSIRVSFRTLRNIPLDVYHPTVTAASGGINHQETLAIKVLPAPLIIQNFSVQPNPFTPNNDGYNDFVEFQYPDPSSGGVSISIFDVNGRKIIEIRNSRYWYGKDDKGRDVKPGAYIYVVKDRDKVMAKGVIALAR